ncbi:MAG: hypothetical protein ABIF87_03605 [Pseudomonadota bacterium]
MKRRSGEGVMGGSGELEIQVSVSPVLDFFPSPVPRFTLSPVRS